MADKTYDEFVKPVAIAYIGGKPHKKDTIARSGAVWDGFGDIKTVDARAASQLLVHKKVFIKAEDLEAFKEKLSKSIPDEDDSEIDPATVGESEKNLPEDDSPKYDSEKIEKIVAAILSLDPSNKDHYFGNGAPKLKAVTNMLGGEIDVSSEELKFALASMSN